MKKTSMKLLVLSALGLGYCGVAMATDAAAPAKDDNKTEHQCKDGKDKDGKDKDVKHCEKKADAPK